MFKFLLKDKLIRQYISILLFLSVTISLNNKVNVHAQPILNSNVYVKINSVNKNSMVFTFFNSDSENLVYTYKIDVIDLKKNEIVKEFEVYTKLFLKETALDTLVFKVNKLKEKNEYVIRINGKECLNGIKINTIEERFKTL